MKRSFRKLDPKKLKEYLELNPDAYLRQIVAKFGCCETTVTYACRWLKIARKKTTHYKEQPPPKIAEYEEKIREIPKDKRVICR